MRRRTGSRGGFAEARRSRYAALLVAAALAATGCKKERAPIDRTHFSDLEIVEGSTVVKTGPVGHSQWKRERSYVLTDLKNTGDKVLKVTLGGHLLDDAGEALSDLEFETLEIPAGARRTFALVDRDSKKLNPANAAKLEIRGAVPMSYQQEVFVREGYVHKNVDGVVAAGVVVNEGARQAKVVVIAGFYDEKGRPMKRPFTLVTIDGGAERPVTLIGPQGSRSGYLFLGDVMH